MLNFGASKPRVKGGPGPPPRIRTCCYLWSVGWKWSFLIREQDQHFRGVIPGNDHLMILNLCLSCTQQKTSKSELTMWKLKPAFHSHSYFKLLGKKSQINFTSQNGIRHWWKFTWTYCEVKETEKVQEHVTIYKDWNVGGCAACYINDYCLFYCE